MPSKRPPDKATPQQLADAYVRWCRTELCDKPSSKVGRTRRGRKKHKELTFPYPRRGKHRTEEVKGRIVTVKADA